MHDFLIRSGRIAAGVGLLVAATAVATGQSPATTVFEGARIIVGDGQPPIENAALVVRGNRITQVGRSGSVKVPQGAARVSLTGKTVMPTIIDPSCFLISSSTFLGPFIRRCVPSRTSALEGGSSMRGPAVNTRPLVHPVR